jgi:drug/metabolite transporter (DMT)-like permease
VETGWGSRHFTRGMNKTLSTLIGFGAILTWAFLALLSTAAGPIPPFQLAAMAFFLGGMVGVASWVFRPHALSSLRQPWQVWALGVGGLCIYHCAYFFAIQSAPPVEVSLIAYLWPLLIVVFASFLPGERLRWYHGVGVVLGLVGAIAIITKGGSISLAGGLMRGHFLALFCAFVWSAYSVLSRRFGQVPVDVVAGYCLITAAVTFVLHLGLETTVWPQSFSQWAAIVVLGSVDNQDSQISIFLIQAVDWQGGQHGWQDENFVMIIGFVSRNFFPARRVMQAGPREITASLWMLFFGWPALAAIGVNCRRALAIGTACSSATTAGPRKAFGRVFSSSWLTTLTLSTS